MKIATARPFQYVARVIAYSWTVDLNTGSSSEVPNQVKTYRTEEESYYKMAIGTNTIGELVIYTDQLFQLSALVNDLRNIRTGNLIYAVGDPKVGAMWRIISAQPVLDAWGEANYYRYRASMIVPSAAAVVDDIPTDYIY